MSQFANALACGEIARGNGDPLLRFTSGKEAVGSRIAETVNLAPLFTAAGAVADFQSKSWQADDRQRRRNRDEVLRLTQRLPWRAISPSESFQSGILLLQAEEPFVKDLPTAAVRSFFAAHGIAVTAYDTGRLRLSLPTHRPRRGELDLLRWTLEFLVAEEVTS